MEWKEQYTLRINQQPKQCTKNCRKCSFQILRTVCQANIDNALGHMFRGTCQHQLYNIRRETQKKNLQTFDKEISSKLLSCKCSTTNQLLSGSHHLLRRENDSILLICPGLWCFKLPREDALWRIRLWKKNPLSKIQPSVHGWTSRSPIYPEQLGLFFIAHQIFHTPIKSSQRY